MLHFLVHLAAELPAELAASVAAQAILTPLWVRLRRRAKPTAATGGPDA